MIHNLIGKRIELEFTGDPYTKLKAGDRGTVTDVTEIPIGDRPYQFQIWTSSDSGSKLALIEGKIE
jgi:hypothetical protein